MKKFGGISGVEKIFFGRDFRGEVGKISGKFQRGEIGEGDGVKSFSRMVLAERGKKVFEDGENKMKGF